MPDDAAYPEEFATITPEGRIVLSPGIMADWVLETPGCDLWYNEKDGAVGIKLLRGNEAPPHPIERRPVSGGGIEGVIEAGGFLSRVGAVPIEARRCPCRFHQKYTVIECRIGSPAARKPASGVLDSFEPIED